jgi:hypothetical protein
MSEPRITINGLTPRQVKMLDVMWNLQTPEDYFEWYENLTEPMQRQADILQKMLILAMADDMIKEDRHDYQEAREVLGKFTLKGHL